MPIPQSQARMLNTGQPLPCVGEAAAVLVVTTVVVVVALLSVVVVREEGEEAAVVVAGTGALGQEQTMQSPRNTQLPPTHMQGYSTGQPSSDAAVVGAIRASTAIARKKCQSSAT